MMEKHLMHAGPAKVSAAVEQVKLCQDSGTSHICVLTHLKATARAIAEELGDVAFVVTGDMTPDQRSVALETAKNLPNAVVVATMHSIGTGIDLVFCTAAVFAELYWQPATVLQAMGRFSRLSGKEPANIYVLILEGTLDEPMSRVLLRKVSDMNKLIDAGASEDKLESALSSEAYTEESFLTELNSVASAMVEEESYG
jgi:ERCC4-related helicase